MYCTTPTYLKSTHTSQLQRTSTYLNKVYVIPEEASGLVKAGTALGIGLQSTTGPHRSAILMASSRATFSLASLVVQTPRLGPVLGPADAIANSLVIDVAVNIDGAVEKLELAPAFALTGSEIALERAASVVVIATKAFD